MMNLLLWILEEMRELIDKWNAFKDAKIEELKNLN